MRLLTHEEYQYLRIHLTCNGRCCVNKVPLRRFSDGEHSIVDTLHDLHYVSRTMCPGGAYAIHFLTTTVGKEAMKCYELVHRASV